MVELSGMDLEGDRSQTLEALYTYRDLDLYPNNKNPVEGLGSRRMSFHKELFNCSDMNGFEEVARVDGHVGERNTVRRILQCFREDPT